MPRHPMRSPRATGACGRTLVGGPTSRAPGQDGVDDLLGGTRMSQDTQGLDRTEASTPAPDDPSKPDSPTDLTKPSWSYVGRKSGASSRGPVHGQAAALTYYAVLALFPPALAISRSSGSSARRREDGRRGPGGAARPLVGAGTLDSLEPILPRAVELSGCRVRPGRRPPRRAVVGVGVVGAFGRAMNRVYEIDEGRPSGSCGPPCWSSPSSRSCSSALVLVMLVVSAARSPSRSATRSGSATPH